MADRLGRFGQALTARHSAAILAAPRIIIYKLARRIVFHLSGRAPVSVLIRKQSDHSKDVRRVPGAEFLLAFRISPFLG